MKRIVFEGTEEQLKNLQLLIESGDNDLPKEVKGVQTHNLWHVDDVMFKYKCNEKQAMDVLIDALTNDATMTQIWEAIDHHAEEEGLSEYFDGLFKVSGYFKEDGAEFSDYLFYAYDNCPDELDDEDIFFFGMSEFELQIAINDEDTAVDFVITSYTKCLQNEI